MKILIAIMTLALTVSCASNSSKPTEKVQTMVDSDQIQPIVSNPMNVNICYQNGLSVTTSNKEISSVIVSDKVFFDYLVNSDSLGFYVRLKKQIPKGTYYPMTVHVKYKNEVLPQVFNVNGVHCNMTELAKVPKVLFTK